MSEKAVGSVLVVGGGIAGMQAAIDLADSGLRVVLAERESAVGGRMVQLDKTFPTGDCSMCTLSPRLVALGMHPDIRLLTRTSLTRLEGHAPRFRATLRREPRYVDVEACKSCGECEKVCPVSEDDAFDLGRGRRKAIHKPYAQAIPNAYAIDKRGSAPCRNACPAHVSVQGYVALAREGRYEEALALIRRDLPLPAVCGRICERPCEEACSRKDVDQPVAIRAIKRFLADFESWHGPPKLPEPKPRREDRRVAVVGAGPAGLTAACALALEGIAVTLFEALDVPGGMLACGVPEYRLPRDVLQAEIEGILDLGVELRCGVRIGADLQLEDLFEREGFDAAFLATGAHASRRLEVEGEELAGVERGLDFLRRASLSHHRPRVRGRVAVIGGGDVALDAARTARRLGAEAVEVICLEERDRMPAHPDEIAEALEEGIELRPGWGPRRLLGAERVEGVELRRCTRVFDEEGRFAPRYEEADRTTVPADAVVVAIGQALGEASLGHPGLELRRSWIAADPHSLETSIPGVFAGGDAVSGPRSAIEAVAHGQRAAASIRAFLDGGRLERGWGGLAPQAEGRAEGATAMPRAKESRIDPEKRCEGFEEVARGLTEEQVRYEAERCLACGACAECYRCVEACEAGAVNHLERARDEVVEVGAVVLAPGFEEIDAGSLGEFGYGRHANVVTGLEYERLLSASGPTGGRVQRPSDGEVPRRVAWIQCIGSRDRRGGRDWCSAVCCMAATKQAIVTREHEPEAQAWIFFMDVRAHGKGFEGFYDRARNRWGVRYERSMVSRVDEVPETRDLEIRWVDAAGGLQTDRFDLLVLSTGLAPPESARELAGTVGIELQPCGFAVARSLDPGSTARPGIFVAGAAEGPRDIPESVTSASSAAARCSELLREARGALISERGWPPEKPVAGLEPRVGVFVCRCGANIAGVVDVPAIVEHARGLPQVAHAEENLYTCSTDTQEEIVRAVEEHDLNRVVVASCTPRTHERLFRDTCRAAGLNPYLFEMANIRDQCSWVHFDDVDAANRKARDLVSMAVRRAAALEPLAERPYPVVRRALVLGGGLAGLTAADSLAEAGFEVTLVEREERLGGRLRRLRFDLDGADPREHLVGLERRVRSHPRVEVLTGSRVVATGGCVGRFESTVETPSGAIQVRHGVTLVATGAAERLPHGQYRLGESERVMTRHQYEERVGDGRLEPGDGGVVMIQCAGSREDDYPHCGRTCCTEAVRTALRIRRERPGAPVTVLYRDVRTFGLAERLYAEARRRGVRFIRYEPEDRPVVSGDDGSLEVRVREPVLGRDLLLRPDLVLLSTGLGPDPEAAELSHTLKLPLGEDGFFLEAHAKLRPLDFASDGFFLCGLAHGPKSPDEVILQARGAAGRAGTVLSRDRLFVSGQTSEVDGERCAACLTCVRVCPFGVPEIIDGAARIEAASCQGCGACAAACPRQAITAHHVDDRQIAAQVGARP